MPGLLILLLVGLLLRLTIAYVLLPGSGFESDIGTYSAWAQRLYTSGPGEFYAEGFFADYPPGYLYILWLGSHLFAFLLGPDNAGPDLIKLGPIVFDLLVAGLLYGLVKRWTSERPDSARLGLIAAALYLFNPVTWYDSAIWGQTDAVGAFVILLGVGALVRGNSEGAAVAAVLAALVKPQFGIVLAPVVGIVLLRRHLLAPGSGPRERPFIGGPIGRWLEREQGPWRLLSSTVVGLGVLIALLAPFGLDIFGFVRLVMSAAGGYPWLSVNAYNPWALFGTEGTQPLVLGGWWSSDTVPFLGPIPAVVVGTVLLGAGFLAGTLRLAWRADRRSIIAVTIFLALAFFVLPTRVHERYLFPVFALMPLLAVADRRWLWALVALSIGAFINFHAILTVPLYATPNLEALPLGDFFRQPLGIFASVALGIAGFFFAASQLRPSVAKVRDPLEAEPRAARPVAGEDSTGLVYLDMEPMEPVESEPPPPSMLQRVRARMAGIAAVAPVRRDRSMLLLGETSGRLTRRDAVLLLAVFLAALMLRTYRVEAPHTMHFDEVYHARTATEFLQHWRYGEPHSIYEFTHPHMAKYLMAAGLMALGNNRVTGETDLDIPVLDAVVERRWLGTAPDRQRHGDRLFVATGQELRAYDLATGALEGAVAGPFEVLAVDPAAHNLFAANRTGTVWQVPTSSFDAARFSGSPGQGSPIAATQFAMFSDLAGELTELAVAHGRIYGVATGGTVIALDALLGSESARIELTGAHSLLGTPSRAQVVADPAQLGSPADVSVVATALANLIARDASELEALIESAVERASPLPVAGYLGTTERVQEEIDAGNLPGISLADAPGVALATPTGIHLLDAATLAPLAELDTDVAVGGMALAEEGAGQPTIYAATGDRLTTVRMPTDESASIGERFWMPGNIDDVYWSESTTMVHALGESPDGAARTVYVVEPRANAVFADARLEFEPAVVVLDIAPDMPNEDRIDLLAIDASGRMATVDIGSNATAYRFPGVLLGALMAACIYLLARFLFARRSIAVIASLLVLADGMFFANARIAMNDIYVAFFIVAAMTVFVPLWLGRWRNRAAIAAGLGAVGLLLGLALASKWVGMYAIGAVGLLILLRSALGRLIALVAVILMTGMLGYIAITPSSTVESPQLNYVFLGLMIGVSALLAIGITRRPVRFTMDELRLVVIFPLLAGAGLLAYGAYRLATETSAGAAAGAFSASRMAIVGSVMIATALALGVAAWVAGRRGLGPLARQPRVDIYREPASPPPPRGWLRPGSGVLGLPWLAALAAITLIPLAVYALSYLPWIELGNRWTETFPAGHAGQTFIDLQKSMYDYHNHLRATHAASSPWWAWPLNLKPVWFEQTSYAGGTTAVIYDTGNLIAFWLAIPAVAFVCWQAWRRRSLALTFVAIAIASLWLPWARIDRATFQYHIFTTLPFSFLALAYFLAELWHGPSPRTWLLARVGAALAVIGAPLLWLLRLPLCAIAKTEQVNAGTEVCGPLARDLTLTDLQGLGLLLALGGLIGAGLLVYASVRGARVSDGTPVRSLLLPISFSVALLGVIIVVIGAGLPGNTLLSTRVQAEQPALLALVLLAVPAYFVLRATDPRRFVVGTLAAAAIWFVAFYPNFASLPVPTALSQIHLGLLPTWNWGFQFAVNMDEPNRAPIEIGSVVILTVAVAALCAAAAYAARNWYSLPRDDEAAEISGLPETS